MPFRLISCACGGNTAEHFSPFAAACVDQVCKKDAFGCTVDGCNKGGITYRFVEVDLKAQLKKQCEALKMPGDVTFTWYLPPESRTSATSTIAMLCNGAWNESIVRLEGSMCKSAIPGGEAEYKGPSDSADICTGPNDPAGAGQCRSPGPDMAAGSVQIRIDRLSLVQFSSAYLTVTQQVAIRPEKPQNFFEDIPKNMMTVFGPFDQMLWIFILVEVIIITAIFLFVEAAVNPDISEGWVCFPTCRR